MYWDLYKEVQLVYHGQGIKPINPRLQLVVHGLGIKSTHPLWYSSAYNLGISIVIVMSVTSHGFTHVHDIDAEHVNHYVSTCQMDICYVKGLSDMDEIVLMKYAIYLTFKVLFGNNCY